MAKKLCIQTENNVTKIALDGVEVRDIISYQLFEDASGAKLQLEVFISNAVEVQK